MKPLLPLSKAVRPEPAEAWTALLNGFIASVFSVRPELVEG